jgi:hypothetical protein
VYRGHVSVSERSHVGFTMREKQLLAALVEAIKSRHPSPLKYAASKTKMEYSSARNMLYRLRNRHDKAKYFLEDYQKFRNQLRGRRYL